MTMLLSVLFLALAMWLSPAAVLGRVADLVPKRPRDGPYRLFTWGRRLPGGGWLQSLGQHPWHKHRLDIAADIELYAAGVSSGLAPATAVALVVDATTDQLRIHWRTVASLLAIGVAPDRAWDPVIEIPGLSELAVLAKNSHESGTAVAAAAQRIATRLRAEVIDQATAQAERAGVLIALPLTICFLPAFLLLGLVPVVVSLAGELF